MKILICFIMSVVLSMGSPESSQDNLQRELHFWKNLFAPFQAKSPINSRKKFSGYYPDQNETENIKVADANAEYNLLSKKSVVPIKHSRYRVMIRPKKQNQVKYNKKENHTENAKVLYNYNKLLEGLNTTDFEKHGDTYVIKKTNYQINTESPYKSNLVVKVDKNDMPVNRDLINLFIKSHLPINLMRIDAANPSDPIEMQKAILLRENYREVVNEFVRYLQRLGIAIDRQVDETRIKVISDSKPGNNKYTGVARNPGRGTNTGKFEYISETTNSGEARSTVKAMNTSQGRYNEDINTGKDINLAENRYTGENSDIVKDTYNENNYAGDAKEIGNAINIVKTKYTEDDTNTGEPRYTAEAKNHVKTLNILKNRYADEAKNTGKSDYTGETINSPKTGYNSEPVNADKYRYSGVDINTGEAKDLAKITYSEEEAITGKGANTEETEYTINKAVNSAKAVNIGNTTYTDKVTNSVEASNSRETTKKVETINRSGEAGYADQVKYTGETIIKAPTKNTNTDTIDVKEARYAGEVVNTGKAIKIPINIYTGKNTSTNEVTNAVATKYIDKSRYTDDTTNGKSKYTNEALSVRNKTEDPENSYVDKAINGDKYLSGAAEIMVKNRHTDEVTNTGETQYTGKVTSGETKYADKVRNTSNSTHKNEAGYSDEAINTDEATNTVEIIGFGEAGYADEATYTSEATYTDKPRYTGKVTSGESKYADKVRNTSNSTYKNEAGYVDEAINSDEATNTSEIIEDGEAGYADEAIYTSKASDAINTVITSNTSKALSGAAINTDEPGHAGKADEAINNSETIKSDTPEARHPGRGTKIGEITYTASRLGGTGYTSEATYTGDIRHTGTRLSKPWYTGEDMYAHEGSNTGGAMYTAIDKYTTTGRYNTPSSILYEDQNGYIVSNSAKYKAPSQEFGRTSHFRTNGASKVVYIDNPTELSKSHVFTYHVTGEPEILHGTASSNIAVDTFTIKSDAYISKENNIGTSQTNVSAVYNGTLKPYHTNHDVMSTQDITKTPKNKNSRYTIITKGHPEYNNLNKKYWQSTQDRVYESMPKPVNKITIKNPFAHQTIPNIFEKIQSNVTSPGGYVSIETRNQAYIGGNTNKAYSVDNMRPNVSDSHIHTDDEIPAVSDIASDWSTFDIMPLNLSKAHTSGTAARPIQSAGTIPPNNITHNVRNITTKDKDYSSKTPKKLLTLPAYITPTTSNDLQVPDTTNALIYNEHLTAYSPNNELYKYDALIKNIFKILFTKQDLVKYIITKIGEVINLFFKITHKNLNANDFKNAKSHNREGINLEIIINNFFNPQKTELENRPAESDIVNIFHHLKNKNEECYNFDSLTLNEDINFFITELQNIIHVFKVLMGLIENQMGIQSSCIQNVLLKLKLFVQSESNCNILDKLQLNNVIEEVLKASLIRDTNGDQFFKRSGGVQT